MASGYSIANSKLISSAGAECVSAPIEIKSTPVSAIARTVLKLTPPDASNNAWPHNEIDRFVLARLDEEQLQPSPEADRNTLIHRLSFDLIGLPPTPEEVQAFVGDPAPDAYVD